MAKATTGSSFGLNTKQVMSAQMMAHGNTEKEVLKAVFLISDKSSSGEKSAASRELHKWMELPGWAECYRSEVKRCMTPAVGQAVRKITEQINHKNAWLANKAANDVLTRFGPEIMGEEDKTIVVKVEGMPELGIPGGSGE